MFFVHKDNPLSKLILKQIDGIFGAQRTGGWDGIGWDTSRARGPEGNIRSWGQLGLTGEWADKPITLRGTDVTVSNWADLIERVAFHGGTKWNPALHEAPRADIIEGNHDKQIVQGVSADRFAIGFMFKRVVDAVDVPVRWVNVHSVDEITAILPESYFARKDRAAQIAFIKATLPSYARGDYSISPAGAKLVISAIGAYGFDSSASGVWRSGKTVSRVLPASTYTNRLVEKAMQRIR